MSNIPIISICVQTYNQIDFIEQCLEGILMQQTDFSYEIILGEDDSNDGTREICKRYTKEHPEKIRLFLRSRKDVIYIGQQPTGRYNFMENLKVCRGKYIAICEGDDYWTDPLKLDKQIKFLENNPKYVACFHPCFIEKQNLVDKELKKQNLSDIQYPFSIRNLLSLWNIPTASIVLRNQFELPDWFARVASGDIALLMLVFDLGKFKLLKDYMSVYRITGNGVSSTHVGYRMVHYRAFLYSHLNEYFNYKYESEIYEALNAIIKKFISKEKNSDVANISLKTQIKQLVKRLK